MADALIIRSWTPKHAVTKHSINMFKHVAKLNPEYYPFDIIDVCDAAITAINLASVEQRKAKAMHNRYFRAGYKYFNHRRHTWNKKQ